MKFWVTKNRVRKHLRSEYKKKATEKGIVIENKVVAKENIALEKELFVE